MRRLQGNRVLEVRGKEVTVVGLGRSGLGAANLLAQLGARVTVTDKKTEGELKGALSKLDPSVQRSLAGHPEEVFLSADMVVVSPGVPLDMLPLSVIKGRIPIIGELELSYQLVGEEKPFIAITGTNGKSTTTALLDFMLRKGGYRTILGGNIGNALTEEIYKRIGESVNRRVGEVTVSPLRRVAVSNMGVDYIVAEVSSFQLETIEQFRPKASAILNITPDHLDRYHALKEYADTKARIFEKQNREDLLVINADDPTTMEVANEKLEIKSERPRILYFSRKKEVEGVYSINGRVYYNTPHSSLGPHDSLLINVEEIRIKGVHNLENAMAASAIAIFLNCPLEAVRDALRTFSGLEHRLEFVRELDGMRYINDSKGTNVGAVIKSLESFSDPLILILGGRDKGGDFSLLRNLVREKVKTLVLIGEAKEKIRKALGDLTETVMADDLREAVYLSRSRAVKGDVVLLSPACASFDMFLDFEDRGRQFKKIVEEFGLK